MRYTQFGDTYLVRLDTGVDIAEALTAFAADQRVDAGTVTGLGAGYGWTLGYFDRAAREYRRQTFPGEWELLSLQGNLAIREGRPIAHVHVVLGGPDFQTVGGHLFEGRVGATCELTVRKLPGYQLRVLDEATGLYLLNL
jgi:hypothetical protein